MRLDKSGRMRTAELRVSERGASSLNGNASHSDEQQLMRKLIWLSLLAPQFLMAQGVIIPPKTVLGTVNGIARPIGSATITVCVAGVAGIPCSPASISIFKDAALTQPLSNPFTTDVNGNYQFAVAAGVYTVTETGTGFAGYSYQLSVACNIGGCTVNVFSLKTLNNVQFCDQQTGTTADVQINDAVAALLAAGGGTLDCRGYGATTQTIAAPVEIGSNSTGKPITGLFDSATKFNCTMTTAGACLTIDGNSSYYATGVAANASWVAAASSSMSNVVLYRNNQARSFVGGFVWGIHAGGNATATVSDALFAVQNPLQLTQIQNIIVGANGITNTVMCKIYATSGNSDSNVDWVDNECDGQGFTGNRALWIGCTASGSLSPASCSSISNIIIDKGLLVHAGTGLAIATVEASNGAGGVNPTGNIRFRGIQVESSNSSTIGILIDGAENVAIDGLQATSVVAGSAVVKLAQPAGTLLDGIKVDSIDNQGAWTTAIQNTVNSLNRNDRGLYVYRKSGATPSLVLDDASGNILNADGNGVQVSRSSTVAGLPTCNAGLQGTFRYVTDATAPTYNATLTGGGAVVVPVFCNGSAWTSH